MTSTTGDGRHPEVAEISDLTEGLLTGERGAEVRAHVAGCSLCADVLASLEEIRELLGSLPEPQLMPDDVAARIDAALAVEAEAATHARSATESGGATVAGGGWAAPRVPRETSSVEAGEAVTEAGEAAESAEAAAKENADVPRGTSASVGRPSAATRPGGGSTRIGGAADHSGPGRTRERQQRRRRWLIAAGALVGVVVLGGLVSQIHPSDGSKSDDSSSVGKSSVGADAQADNAVGTQVRRLLASPSGKSGTGGVNSPMLGQNGETSVTAPNGSSIMVPRCVLQATERAERPLAAQRETFHGTDSYLVVLPDTDDSTVVDAFVISASCPPGDSGLVLLQQSYPRD